MGGHGGLNILAQKRWNVYNFENREKVRKDEEAAARAEQLQREQSRRRDAESRHERLRQARGLPAAAGPRSHPSFPPDSHHINLFDGLRDFPSLAESDPVTAGGDEEGRSGQRNLSTRDECSRRDSKRKREEGPAVIPSEDEKYRMGYGVAGKGVKAPWYLSRRALPDAAEESDVGRDSGRGRAGDSRKKEAREKKTVEELREERLKRENLEKEREGAVVMSGKRERRGL